MCIYIWLERMDKCQDNYEGALMYFTNNGWPYFVSLPQSAEIPVTLILHQANQLEGNITLIESISLTDHHLCVQ